MRGGISIAIIHYQFEICFYLFSTHSIDIFMMHGKPFVELGIFCRDARLS